MQTGLRVSELLALTHADVHLGTGPHVRAIGKGRKERVAPLTRQSVAVLRVWMRESRDQPDLCPLFPSRHGGPLTRDGTERRLAKHVATAQRGCPTLRSKRVSMHVLRHTAAMALLNAGADTSTIALWLGHEQERTTPSTCTPTLRSNTARSTASHPQRPPGRYRAPDTLLAFLEAL